MKSKIIITFIALLLGMIAAALGQQTRPPGEGTKDNPYQVPVVSIGKEYKPTELQQLKLQVRQKDAQLAQVALREAQSNFQQKVKDLMEEGVAVQKAQGWPDTVTMNPDSLVFTTTEVAKTDKKEPVKP